MNDGQGFYSLLADAVLVTHLLVIVFVIGGLLAVLIGRCRHWQWVYNPWFRIVHLLVIIIVVVQTWAGAVCPLTVWENRLRRLAGEETYAGAFIRHWLHRLIFYQGEAWVFGLVYTLFGLLVLLAFILVPPLFRQR